MSRPKRDFNGTKRLSCRLTLEDVDRMELYMHSLSRMYLRAIREGHTLIVKSRTKRRIHLTVEMKRQVLHEIARIEMFIEHFDAIVGGRGSVYVFEDLALGGTYRFGNLDIAHKVMGISKRTITNGVSRESLVNRRYRVRRYSYDELTEANRINGRNNQ